ncbi:MAG: hypothetical protein V4525_12650 [Pseudomonadota bacterium]
MKRSVPTTVKLTITVLSLFIFQKSLEVLLSLPELLVVMTLSQTPILPLLAVTSSIVALTLLARDMPISRWASAIALTLVYISHFMTFMTMLTSLVSSGTVMGAELVGMALFEAFLFYSFLALCFILCFDSSVKQFFQSRNSTNTYEYEATSS